MIESSDFSKTGGGDEEPEETPTPVKKTTRKRTTKKKVEPEVVEQPTKIEPEPAPSKLVVKMRTGSSFSTAEGVTFTRQHPFHVCSEFEANLLCSNDRFRLATKDEVKEFYG